MLGVSAEFERNLRRERQMEGIKGAKRRGVYQGRRPWTGAAEVRRLDAEEKLGPVAISRRLEIGRAQSIACSAGSQKLLLPSPPFRNSDGADTAKSCAAENRTCASGAPAASARAAAGRTGSPRRPTGRTMVRSGSTNLAGRAGSHRPLARPRAGGADAARRPRRRAPGSLFANNRLRNLRSLCQRCHLLHDRPHHSAQRQISYRPRRAVGDLFLGSYWRPVLFLSEVRS